MTALAWAAPFLILGGCTSYALSRDGRGQPWLLVRARFAWRCRGKPVPGDGDRLSFDETKTLGGIVSGRKRTARPERTRT